MIKLPFELETEVTGASGFAGTADAWTVKAGG